MIGTGSAGSGGTIQKTTSDGILLTSTFSPSFDRMIIKNTAASGVNGTTVTNFTFTNGTIDTCGTAIPHSNISFNTSAIANNISGVITITGNSLLNAYYSGVDIQSGDGTISDMTISNNTVTSSTSSASSLRHRNQHRRHRQQLVLP